MKLEPGFYWYLGPGLDYVVDPDATDIEPWRVVEVDEDGLFFECGTDLTWEVVDALEVGRFERINEPAPPATFQTKVN